jgi:uncharacterized membrane protein
MENKKFSNKEALKFGWETLKENLGFFLIVVSILLIVSIIPSIAKEIYKKTDSASIKIITNIINLFFQIIAILLELGLIKITLKLINQQKASLVDLFSQYHLFFKYLLGLIIYSIIIIAGLILFIVPGIIWGIKFRFFPYFIVEGSGIIESFEKSAAITQGYKSDLFIFNLVLFLISIAGIIAFFIGVLITIPIVSMATVFVYQKLKQGINFSENQIK